ncbi:hypothetical protein U9M48_036034 [Paspalum notatum var. saurae]|uniref:DUF4216 domain-containing protein n=1 Tax=Paspalum notatum var. saurae TaxID=547442 RepID=A0AAQ3UDT0_PASNO
MPGYTIWTNHGENPASVPTLEHPYNTADGLDEMLADFGDAQHANSAEDEAPADAKASMLAASKEPLHSFTKVAKLPAVARLMSIKSQHNLSAECINKLLDLFGDVLPESHKMPKNLYECKSLHSGLKMPYVKIDACTNNCMIYYKEDKDKEKCDFCGESRYGHVEPTHQGHKRKPIARKVLRYVPVIPRLQRMFMEASTAKHMQWHQDGKRANLDVMVHPSDAEAWQHFSTVFPDFAMDAKNCDKDASIPSELCRLSRGCGLKVKSYDIYEVNGHRFRSEKYEKSRGNLTTTNTGVLAVGPDDGSNNELEYYGIIKDIIELKFDGDSEFNLVLFDCYWFHPTNGVRHMERFGLVEVAHASCNLANEPFVLASQVKQVYYLPYACKSDPRLNAWWVAYKVSPLGNLSIPSIDEYNDEGPPCVDTFQEDGLEGEFVIDIGLGLDDLTISDGFDEINDPNELSMLIKQRNGMTISHRGTRSRSSSSVAATSNTVSNHNEPDDHPVADEQIQDVHLRGSPDLPPIIPNEQDRPLVEPQGNSHWTECQGRTPASVLTCLLKSHHPGLVEYRGKTVVATTWKHYQATVDTSGKSAADFVGDGFWSKKLGREVSHVEAWIHTHRGSNPEDITSLNSEEATACLEKYKAKAFELNGPEFDWLHSPVDARALYECSCGRPHGKWAIFNGIVKDREVIPVLRRSHASVMAARRQRQEEEEHLRKEARDIQLANEYAQNMFEWGRMVHAHNVNIQKFMETVALLTGMPTTAVPSPLPPPPLPPAYATSPPPNPSPEYAGTVGSSVGMETPEQTLSRIANGVFHGHVNATTSGGGTCSPHEDEFPLF